MATEATSDAHAGAAPPAPVGAGGSAPGVIRHYMLPNFTSILPEYANVGQDVVRQAFRTGNHASLRRLPDSLTPEALLAARQQQMAAAQEALKTSAGTPAASLRGLFTEFEYIPSRYDLAEQLQMQERFESKAKVLKISGKEFVPAGPVHRLKHEDVFSDAVFQHMSEPFGSQAELERRHQWLQRSKVLFGPFVPAGTSKVVGEVTRSLLPDIMRDLHTALRDDWEDCTFSVLVTADDTIVVRFELATVDTRPGLLAYMNCLAQRGDLVSRYALRRLVPDWNSEPGDGFLYFAFQPPWVHVPARAIVSAPADAPADEAGGAEDAPAAEAADDDHRVE